MMKRILCLLIALQFLSSPAFAWMYVPSTGGSSAPTLNTISSGSTNTLSSLTTIATTQIWTSTTASAKTQNILACSSGVSGYAITIKDAAGTAGAYNITITPASGTIDGLAYLILTISKQSVTIECDGNSNWMVI